MVFAGIFNADKPFNRNRLRAILPILEAIDFIFVDLDLFYCFLDTFCGVAYFFAFNIVALQR